MKQSDKIIPVQGDKERALISLILMNGGKISETKLKRIYLEKFTYWEMQRTDRTFGFHEIRVTSYDNVGNPSENKKVKVLTLF